MGNNKTENIVIIFVTIWRTNAAL